MPQFRVSYTFGAVLIVEAEDEEAARGRVEAMPTDELLAHAQDGFEIQDIEDADG